MTRKAINRIKAVLVKKKLSSKWIAERLCKSEVANSRCCTNDIPPPLTALAKKNNVTPIPIELLNK